MLAAVCRVDIVVACREQTDISEMRSEPERFRVERSFVQDNRVGVADCLGDVLIRGQRVDDYLAELPEPVERKVALSDCLSVG